MLSGKKMNIFKKLFSRKKCKGKSKFEMVIQEFKELKNN